MKPRRLTPEDLARIDRFLCEWHERQAFQFWMFSLAVAVLIFLCLKIVGLL
jgi:hypothetical protein